MPETPALPSRPAITRTGGANPFDAAAEDGERYDAVRPSYPQEAVGWVLEGLPAPADVVETGAGTGLFTGLLAAQPAERVRGVVAVEPSASMRAVLERRIAAASAGRVQALNGTGEETGLPEVSADVVVAAQAWHWMDVPAASAEAARVLRPGGRLAAVWNQLDVTVPWVHRLTRIMHAGDVHAAAPQQRRFAAPFGAEQHARWSWSVPATPERLHDLMASRSYWLRAGEATRARMTANLAWYLGEHLGHGPGEEITLPYLTVAWRAAAPRHRRLSTLVCASL
ncbi:class I SAM-dependent methyltransferase [Micrococcus sp.]|uniref:class I SAM-dependent methyltransferase n=1 Tax=Micrococcus sp. TaxID=1271 RepID=UPI002A91F919|nr:class I SAM-dependent methyltransferase [Micrococcus sp.]MDY6055308.1 class I SAM-dependent methyltransferase [Micrococcus sp.]